MDSDEFNPAASPSLAAVLLCPAPLAAQDSVIPHGSELVVVCDDLAHAMPLTRVAAVTAALASDLVVAVIPAHVGVDAATAQVWQAAAEAGVPRAVIINGLGAQSHGFEDIAAIAARALGPECVLWRLPVFDDDETVIGSLDVADGALRTADRVRTATRAHRRVSVGARLRLVEALAGVTPDTAAADRAMAISDAAEPDDPDADLVVWGEGSVWDLTSALEGALHAADLAPVSPGDGSPGEVAGLLRSWFRAGGDQPPRRLMRRGADSEPSDGTAGVVLAAHRNWGLVRAIYGDSWPRVGLLALTRVGLAMGSIESPGRPLGGPVQLAPFRAWPVGVLAIRPPDEAPPGHSKPAAWLWLHLTMRPEIGDVLADRDLWLINEPAD